MDPNTQNQPPANTLPPAPPPIGPPQGAVPPQPLPGQTAIPNSIPQPMPGMQQMAQPGMMAPPQPQAYQGQPAYQGGAAPLMPGQPQAAAVPPAPKSNPNSTQNTLQIAEIRDGIVIMNDGSFRSVIMVKSINFDLMSPQEQEGVEYAYQSFLNSLYFPVQIFIRSQKVDLRPYIEKLDKIRTEHDNMLLTLLMEDYIDYIANLSMQTNIMDKKFFVIVPYFPVTDVQKALTQSKNFFSGLTGMFKSGEQRVVINEQDLAKAKDELRNRVQATLAGLQQCSVQGLPLDTQELIELYYDTYNPDTATRQELKNFGDLTAPVVMKGQGTAAQPHLDREMI